LSGFFNKSFCVQVGKSSLINSLLKKSSLPVYTVASSSKGPTTTELPQEVSLNANGTTITLVDTPGLSFVPEDGIDESLQTQIRAKDILLRSKGRIDRLKDPTLPSRSFSQRTGSWNSH
jgi:nuclear GTP-binding protein